jgi:hypothetical protein
MRQRQRWPNSCGSVPSCTNVDASAKAVISVTLSMAGQYRNTLLRSDAVRAGFAADVARFCLLVQKPELDEYAQLVFALHRMLE